jgi:PIN domain nuclease of toxin-antitoxin system
MSVPLLDTHVWIWYLSDRSRLQSFELDALNGLDFGNRPFISDFSLWEIATLANRNRLLTIQPFSEWLARAARPEIVRILPVTTQIAVELSTLPDSFHRDPADRTIVATARAHDLPLLTYDNKILSSGLVRQWNPKR